MTTELKELKTGFYRESDMFSLQLSDIDKETLAEETRKNGGVTVLFNNVDLSRYIVGIQGFKIENTQDSNVFSRAIDTVQAIAILASDTRGYGVWKDGSDIYFDAIFTTNDKQEALNLAKKYDQLAIFDAENFEEIEL